MSDQSTAVVNYRPVVGFTGYRVGDDGSIWSCLKLRSRGRQGNESYLSDEWVLLNPTTNKRGYLFVSLRKNGGAYNRFVHRLVLETFVGQCPDGMEARHFPDGSPKNNALTNLAWGTKKQNATDREIHGNTVRETKHYENKLDETSVREIKRGIARGESKLSLAEKFKTSRKTIRRIVAGQAWGWVHDEV